MQECACTGSGTRLILRGLKSNSAPPLSKSNGRGTYRSQTAFYHVSFPGKAIR